MYCFSTVMYRLTKGISSEKCHRAISLLCERHRAYWQTLKPGIDLDSLWMKVLSGILFRDREVSSISKICSGKQLYSPISLSRVYKRFLPPLYMRSIVDLNVVMQRMTVQFSSLNSKVSVKAMLTVVTVQTPSSCW